MRGVIGFYLISLFINILVNVMCGWETKMAVGIQVMMTLLMAGVYLLVY